MNKKMKWAIIIGLIIVLIVAVSSFNAELKKIEVDVSFEYYGSYPLVHDGKSYTVEERNVRILEDILDDGSLFTGVNRSLLKTL